MSAVITIKGKLQAVYDMDGQPLYQYLPVPVLARKHCDMQAFRQHSRYGSYANSDLFPGMLARVRADLLKPCGLGLRLDQLPDNVTLDTAGFLAVARISV